MLCSLALFMMQYRRVSELTQICHSARAAVNLLPYRVTVGLCPEPHPTPPHTGRVSQQAFLLTNGSLRLSDTNTSTCGSVCGLFSSSAMKKLSIKHHKHTNTYLLLRNSQTSSPRAAASLPLPAGTQGVFQSAHFCPN